MSKKIIGIIISDKMVNTAVVEVEYIKKHKIYKKKYKRSRHFKVDNPQNSYKIGQKVEIEEIAPMAKNKHFKITKEIKQR